jgi:hypothetical protein
MASLIVVSKVKEMTKAAGMRASQEFLHALSEHVAFVVVQAAKAAKRDKMMTIKAKHMVVHDD